MQIGTVKKTCKHKLWKQSLFKENLSYHRNPVVNTLSSSSNLSGLHCKEAPPPPIPYPSPRSLWRGPVFSLFHVTVENFNSRNFDYFFHCLIWHSYKWHWIRSDYIITLKIHFSVSWWHILKNINCRLYYHDAGWVGGLGGRDRNENLVNTWNLKNFLKYIFSPVKEA